MFCDENIRFLKSERKLIAKIDIYCNDINADDMLDIIEINDYIKYIYQQYIDTQSLKQVYNAYTSTSKSEGRKRLYTLLICTDFVFL